MPEVNYWLMGNAAMMACTGNNFKTINFDTVLVKIGYRC